MVIQRNRKLSFAAPFRLQYYFTMHIQLRMHFYAFIEQISVLLSKSYQLWHSLNHNFSKITYFPHKSMALQLYALKKTIFCNWCLILMSSFFEYSADSVPFFSIMNIRSHTNTNEIFILQTTFRFNKQKRTNRRRRRINENAMGNANNRTLLKLVPFSELKRIKLCASTATTTTKHWHASELYVWVRFI